MITKEGYVFIARFRHYNPLMGKETHSNGLGYENLSTNDITLFELEKEMKEAAKRFTEIYKQIESLKTLPAHLKISIAENLEEARKLGEGDLIAIINRSEREEEPEYIFLGPRVDGKLSIACGATAKLELNGYQYFNKLGDEYTPQTALYGARETSRQMDRAPVRIAKFILNKR
jgi:hypothetical protein